MAERSEGVGDGRRKCWWVRCGCGLRVLHLRHGSRSAGGWATLWVTEEVVWLTEVLDQSDYGTSYGESWQVREIRGQLECVACGKVRWFQVRKPLTPGIR